VAREGAPVAVAPAARAAVREGRERVEDIVESGDAVYGVNTGFGELVAERIDTADLAALQKNLVRSHAAGAGAQLSVPVVRAMMLTRLNALLRGHSGVRERVVDQLVTMLNEGVHPVVPAKGSLGASGDLAPLAHLALGMLGEGKAIVAAPDSLSAVDPLAASGTDGTEDQGDPGERMPTAVALENAELDPLTLAAKEGLALINGTQLTVGRAALLVVDAERLLAAADTAGALSTEVSLASTVPSHPAIHDVRPHPGPGKSADIIRRLTDGSEVVESHKNCDRVQDPYSFRCLPQVHGAVREAVAHLRTAVETELNSATDNPLVFARGRVDDRASGTDTAAVLSGGNFHGEILALRLDYVTAALTELATIAERRTDQLLNPNLQEAHLPPFLTTESGVESGYMIAQYTAASLVNECRSLGRAATDNTPVSGNQEDHVSMSAQAAEHARTALDNVARVVGIELLCGTQATTFLDSELRLGIGTSEAKAAVREVVPPLEEDRQLHDEIEQLGRVVIGDGFRDRIEAAIDGELS
jgi:histidine ammonia-lyase